MSTQNQETDQSEFGDMLSSNNAAAVDARSLVTTDITPRKPLIDVNLKEIWRYRDLILLSVRRDFIATHKQTVLGPLWFIIQPLITTVAFGVIFRGIARLPTDDIPPFMFYMSGIVLWYYFSSCLTKSSQTFSANAALFTKVYFPRLTLPISQMISNGWQLLIQLGIFIGFYLFFYLKGAPLHPNFRIIIVPALIIQVGLLGLGCGLIIASVTTRIKDLQMAVAPAIQLWMYASCVFFPLSLVPSEYQWLMSLNPIVPIIETFRFAVMGRGETEIYRWLISVGVTAVILVVGLLCFSRSEKTFADTI